MKCCDMIWHRIPHGMISWHSFCPWSCHVMNCYKSMATDLSSFLCPLKDKWLCVAPSTMTNTKSTLDFKGLALSRQERHFSLVHTLYLNLQFPGLLHRDSILSPCKSDKFFLEQDHLALLQTIGWFIHALISQQKSNIAKCPLEKMQYLLTHKHYLLWHQTSWICSQEKPSWQKGGAYCQTNHLLQDGGLWNSVGFHAAALTWHFLSSRCMLLCLPFLLFWTLPSQHSHIDTSSTLQTSIQSLWYLLEIADSESP